MNKFEAKKNPLWHLTDIQHHFQEDEMGCKYLVGLTFTIRAGVWAEFFLNQSGCKQQSAFYKNGILPQSLLRALMSIWQQHERAARMML